MRLPIRTPPFCSEFCLGLLFNIHQLTLVYYDNNDNTCTAPCVYFLHQNANWMFFLCTGHVQCVGCDVHILVMLESSSFQEMPTLISFEQSQFQNVRNSDDQHLWQLNFTSCQVPELQNLSHTVCQMEELPSVKNQHRARFPAKCVQTSLGACT